MRVAEMLRVLRPWPGVRRGDEVYIEYPRSENLVRGGFAERVAKKEPAKPRKGSTRPQPSAAGAPARVGAGSTS